jgi:hypothetical protein
MAAVGNFYHFYIPLHPEVALKEEAASSSETMEKLQLRHGYNQKDLKETKKFDNIDIDNIYKFNTRCHNQKTTLKNERRQNL